MHQRSMLFGLFCLGLILSSCKKETDNVLKDIGPGNTRETIWQEIAKISKVSKFSKIDTAKVNQNIDKGLLTVEKLREKFAPLAGGIPIMDNEYTEDTYVGGTANTSCSYNFTFTFWNLKSRGYPSVYTIGWVEGGSAGHNLSYAGYDPIADYTFTSTGIGGGCTTATGYGNLEEDILGFHRNWTVETSVVQFAATLWKARIKLTKV